MRRDPKRVIDYSNAKWLEAFSDLEDFDESDEEEEEGGGGEGAGGGGEEGGSGGAEGEAAAGGGKKRSKKKAKRKDDDEEDYALDAEGGEGAVGREASSSGDDDDDDEDDSDDETVKRERRREAKRKLAGASAAGMTLAGQAGGRPPSHKARPGSGGGGKGRSPAPPLPPLLQGEGEGLLVLGLSSGSRRAIMEAMMRFGINPRSNMKYDQFFKVSERGRGHKGEEASLASKLPDLCLKSSCFLFAPVAPIEFDTLDACYVLFRASPLRRPPGRLSRPTLI